MKTFLQFAIVLCATLAIAQAPSSFRDRSTGPTSAAAPPDLSNVRIDQNLNQQVPLDLQFKDETGKTVKLGDYFQSGRPVVLSLVYYTCPMLCGEELAGEASALSMLKFTPGNEYQVVSVSFNPDETPKDAAEKKQVYIARMNEHLDHKTNGEGWAFLTGQEPQIKQLADAVGFHYRRDAATGQYIHATAIMIVTPSGKIAQYYYGVEYSPKDIRLGFVEASRDKIGTVADQVLLYCYHYDPRPVVTARWSLTSCVWPELPPVLVLGGISYRDVPPRQARAATREQDGHDRYVVESAHYFRRVPAAWHGRWTDFISSWWRCRRFSRC